MIFEVAIYISSLKKYGAADTVMRETAFAQIYGRAEAHAKVFSKGFISSQVAARADFGCTSCHYEAKQSAFSQREQKN